MYTIIILAFSNNTSVDSIESEIINFIGRKNLINNSLNVYVFEESFNDKDKQILIDKIHQMNSDILFMESETLELINDLNTIKI